MPFAKLHHLWVVSEIKVLQCIRNISAMSTPIEWSYVLSLSLSSWVCVSSLTIISRTSLVLLVELLLSTYSLYSYSRISNVRVGVGRKGRRKNLLYSVVWLTERINVHSIPTITLLKTTKYCRRGKQASLRQKKFTIVVLLFCEVHVNERNLENELYSSSFDIRLGWRGD